MNNDRFAKTVRLREPSTGRLFVPVKMKKRDIGQYGFRILPANDNLAESDEVTDSEGAVVRALRVGLLVRCVPCDEPRTPASALALDGKLGLTLERV